MKKTLVAAILALTASSMVQVYGQGQLSWGTVWGNTVTGVRAPVFGVNTADPMRQVTGNNAAGLPVGNADYGGAPLVAGTGFTMALYAGASASAAMAQLTASDMTVFRTGTAAGFMVGPRSANIDGILPGNPANVQFRAWDNRGGTITSWAAIMADPTIPHGSSDVFTTGNLGGIDSAGGVVPTPQSTGIRSFNLVQVPEPSLIALGALALGGLLLRRRK